MIIGTFWPGVFPTVNRFRLGWWKKVVFGVGGGLGVTVTRKGRTTIARKAKMVSI